MKNEFPMANDASRLGSDGWFRRSSFVIHHFYALCMVVLTASWLAQAQAAVFTPANPPAMKRIASHDTPAWQAMKHFQHGVNLGNYLEVPPGQNWAVTVTARDFVFMKQQGFDHVRIPVGWQHYVGPAPGFRIQPAFFARVDFCVTNALHNGLAVIINIHHFTALAEHPRKNTAEFLKIWQQVAAYYQHFPAKLAFELDNEPHGPATTAVMNPIYARAITEIRRTNPTRTLFVEPGHWGSISQLKNLVLPPDRNVIVSVHCYDPFYFTHQGASWTHGMTPLTGIVFPGPPKKPLVPNLKLHLRPGLRAWLHKYNTLPTRENPSSPLAFKVELKYAHDWSEYYGRPVHIGEFGAYTKADEASRVHFYSAFRRAAEKLHLGWCIWDWSAGFRYWDEAHDRPLPGMHRALFGPPH